VSRGENSSSGGPGTADFATGKAHKFRALRVWVAYVRRGPQPKPSRERERAFCATLGFPLPDGRGSAESSRARTPRDRKALKWKVEIEDGLVRPISLSEKHTTHGRILDAAMGCALPYLLSRSDSPPNHEHLR
jgi:hypothetical protein